MKRKEFLTTACGACGMGFLAGILLTQESCAPKAGTTVTKYVPEGGKISVPLDVFGSNNIHVIKVKGSDDLGLVKKSDGTYLAFAMTCTHQGVGLKEKDGKFVCPAHGSTFSSDGNVEKGPAKKVLASFKTAVAGDKLEVFV